MLQVSHYIYDTFCYLRNVKHIILLIIDLAGSARRGHDDAISFMTQVVLWCHCKRKEQECVLETGLHNNNHLAYQYGNMDKVNLM